MSSRRSSLRRIPTPPLVREPVQPIVPNINEILPTNWSEMRYNLATRTQLTAVAIRHGLQVPQGAIKSVLFSLLKEARIPPPLSRATMQFWVDNAKPIADGVNGSDAILPIEQLHPEHKYSQAITPPPTGSAQQPPAARDCPISQAQIIFRCRETKQQYDIENVCSLCGMLYEIHPMSVATDPQEMLKAVFNPEANESKAKAPSDYQQKMLEVSVDKAVRELSEHSQIKGTFNPLKQLTKVFLQEYESRMSILAGQQHLIWIRVLPAVLHWSIKAEFSWVNNNISLVPDRTWNEAKRLFSEHWRKTNSHLMLKTLYNDLKQGPQQSVNEFANEFRKQMQLNDLAEDQRVCDDFLMKLRPAICNQVLLQLRLREQAGLMGDQMTLNQLEDTARLIDSAMESQDDLQSKPPFENRDSSRNESKKRFRDQHRNNNSRLKELKPSKGLHCDNHPHLTNHSTDECRSKRTKPGLETPSPKIKQEPNHSTDKNLQTNPKKPRLTPKDDAWICVKCKKKAPGHYPPDCPQK